MILARLGGQPPYHYLFRFYHPKVMKKKWTFNLLSSVIDPLEDFAKAALANPLLLREDNLRVHFLHTRREYEYMFKIFNF